MKKVKVEPYERYMVVSHYPFDPGVKVKDSTIQYHTSCKVEGSFDRIQAAEQERRRLQQVLLGKAYVIVVDVKTSCQIPLTNSNS